MFKKLAFSASIASLLSFGSPNFVFAQNKIIESKNITHISLGEWAEVVSNEKKMMVRVVSAYETNTCLYPFSNSRYAAPEGAKLVVVNLEATNIWEEQITLPYLKFSLNNKYQDGTGQNCSYGPNSWGKKSSKIYPGVTVSGSIMFEVPLGFDWYGNGEIYFYEPWGLEWKKSPMNISLDIVSHNEEQETE